MGIKCPKCKSTELILKDSETDDEDNIVFRQQKCAKCGEEFMTKETISKYPFKD